MVPSELGALRLQERAPRRTEGVGRNNVEPPDAPRTGTLARRFYEAFLQGCRVVGQAEFPERQQRGDRAIRAEGSEVPFKEK
jgi:hypothetical protein